MVVGRAIIRDRFQGAEAQRLMAQVTLVFSIAPAIAPIIGGALLNTLGWRSIFWILLLWVLIVLVWSTRYLPETLPASHRHVFAVLLWFVVLPGPCGALLYRMSAIVDYGNASSSGPSTCLLSELTKIDRPNDLPK